MMPTCPDCLREGLLNLMIYAHDEEFKGRLYAVLICISCGSSVRVRKVDHESKLKELNEVISMMEKETTIQ